MADVPSRPDFERRLAAVEAQLEIGQLPIRYALAVDGRDVDAWVNLFVPDVYLGRAGRGRQKLKEIITPQIRGFYRSMHQIVGHRVQLTGADTAEGDTYCRAEHEVGDRWIVMAIRYRDDYRKVDGAWLFERRREQHWYAVDHTDRPQSVGFLDWEASSPPPLPHDFPTWREFWQGVDVSPISRYP